MKRTCLGDERPEAGIFVDHASVVHDAGDLTRKSREMLKRYGFALALPGLALFLRSVLPFPEGTAIYELPLAAVVLSAWYGGRGPALLASLICITGVGYGFVPPVNSFAIAPDHVLPFSIFIGLCLLLSEFGAGRRRSEQALRASGERFRTLVQLSFGVYWETDAQHRFTRQEFSDRLTDALATSSVIGKTRWEIPYLEPDEEAWRRHRATLDAHLPFQDFEHARPTPDGGKRHVSVSGMPVFDEFGRFVGYRGVGRNITDRKLAEAARRAHVWFLASMDRVNRAMQGTNDVEQMMGDVLQAVLEIFANDRAWLIYPCDPDAPSWRPIMERTRPEVPGAAALGHDWPMTPESAEVARVALASSGALLRGGSHTHQPGGDIAEDFGVRSDMLMALRPKGDRPYLFGLHQCSRVRTWTKEEQRLFEEVGHRLSDALGSLIAFRGLRESEARLERAQRLARVGWWERDYATGHVSLSDEACRIFGVQPLERLRRHGDWLSLIHPEDRENAAAVSDLALRGAARYDVEYRVVRPDGAVRVVHSQGDVTRDESGRAVRQFGVSQDITELRQAEEAMRESEQRYRTLFEKANDAIFVENERDDIVDANERACALLGCSRHELLTMKVPDLQAPEVRGQVGRVIRERIEAHGSATFETVDLHRSGRRIPVEVTISEISHRGENLVLSVVRDITERKRIEAELRARQELLDLAQKAARAVAFNWYIGARESENRWSPELEDMYGLEPGTFDGTYQGWKQLVHPDDWPAVKVAINRAHESGDVAAEYRVIHKDGTVRWLRAKGRMFLDAKGQPERMIGFMIDVTDWRDAQEALRASEARFRTFADHATDAFFLHDEQLTVIDVNRQACASLGYRREELIGRDPRDFDADLDGTAIARLADRIGAGETVTFETRHRRKDGGVFPVEIRVRQFQQGARRFHVALARDISERKRTEQRMLAQHTVAQILADAATVDDAMPRLLEAVCECLDWDLGALWRVDREAGVLRCAQVWRRASLDAAQFETATRESTFEPGVGLPGRVWVARAPACIPDVVHEANFVRGSIAADAGLHAAFAFPILLRGEVLGVIDLLSRDVRQPDQELLDMMVSLGSQIGQFIERKRAEDALRAAQSEVTHLARVMTMGELTASIAHEVNQPIAAAITDASTCVRWLSRTEPDLDEARQAAERTVKDATRAADIITRIRRLFKHSGFDAESVNVNDVVEELITLLRREALQSRVSITTALAPDLPLVMGDRVQLQQVLLNLLMNSLEATKGVGDRREITVTSRRADGDQVHVAVTDTGVGLPPTGADELFKAFVTTKAGGTGMGLAISRSIIDAHGGRLWAASNADRGATFTFTLPIARDMHA